VSRARASQDLRPPAFVYKNAALAQAGKPKPHGEALYCESVSLKALAARHGTPLYVYSAAMIRARLHAFARAFRSIPHTLCYSVKANSTLAILRLIAAEGAGFDVVSGGELERILRVNRKAARKVVFSGVGKTASEMELALRSGILLFNVESASELNLLASIATRSKKRAAVAIRVNPDVSAKTHPYISTGLHQHKFGVPIPEATKLYAEAAKHPYLQVAGVSVHIGSQITDIGSFKDALLRVTDLVHALRKQGHDIRYIDAGGGLGISYEQPRQNFEKQIAAYAKAVLASLRGLHVHRLHGDRLNVHLLLEPGRSIVGAAGVLLTRVLYRKTNNSKRFLIVDAAMNDLMRPSLYGAYHEIVPVKGFSVAKRFGAAINPRLSTSALAAEVSDTTLGNRALSASEITDVVGPICETGDFFARDRELPVMQEGDLLAILDTGAYGAVLASNYNTRGRPAEVLVDGATSRLIRSRETAGDQMHLEC
jgi:diaminopimelate decarboxylase